MILAGGLGSSPISDIIVTDLPEPLSPTTPSSSPGAIEKLTPLTAWTAPSRVANTVRRSETSRTGAGPSSMRQAPWRLRFRAPVVVRVLGPAGALPSLNSKNPPRQPGTAA